MDVFRSVAGSPRVVKRMVLGVPITAMRAISVVFESLRQSEI